MTPPRPVDVERVTLAAMLRGGPHGPPPPSVAQARDELRAAREKLDRVSARYRRESRWMRRLERMSIHRKLLDGDVPVYSARTDVAVARRDVRLAIADRRLDALAAGPHDAALVAALVSLLPTRPDGRLRQGMYGSGPGYHPVTPNTAQRLLERMAGCQLAFMRQSDSTRLVAHGTIDLGQGFGWTLGRLHDTRSSIPSTLATAAVGRPLGHLLDHPHVDPDAVMREPSTPGSIVDTDAVAVVVAKPSPRTFTGLSARLRARLLVMRHRRAERPGRWLVPLLCILMFAGICTPTLILSTLTMGSRTPAVIGMLVFAACLAGIVDVVLGMPFSDAVVTRFMGHAEVDDPVTRRHDAMIARIHAGRGFAHDGERR